MRPAAVQALVIHAVIHAQAKATLCDERPARGLIVDRDDKVTRFLQLPSGRCDPCRIVLHARLARIKEAHERNERKLAAERLAVRQPHAT